MGNIELYKLCSCHYYDSILTATFIINVEPSGKGATLLGFYKVYFK